MLNDTYTWFLMHVYLLQCVMYIQTCCHLVLLSITISSIVYNTIPVLLLYLSDTILMISFSIWYWICDAGNLVKNAAIIIYFCTTNFCQPKCLSVKCLLTKRRGEVLHEWLRHIRRLIFDERETELKNQMIPTSWWVQFYKTFLSIVYKFL